MNQIIQAISQKLGLPEDVVRTGITILLNFVKQKAEGTQYQAFLNLIPGLNDLANAPAPAPQTGGGLGGLLGNLSSIFGGQGGDVAKALGSFQAAGIKPDQVPPFVKTFFDQAKQVAGPGEVDKLLSSMPALSKLLGS
ncbi:MAG: DUF2780 domain-containing protein [Verrucomicrobia bacterium]|nr:DUF2780 domain-containing protein [Verrucomicrobiota bacterium]